jgi:hypothetical protein
MTPNAIKSEAGMFLWSYNIGELVDSSGTRRNMSAASTSTWCIRVCPARSPIAAILLFRMIFPTLPNDPSAGKNHRPAGR